MRVQTMVLVAGLVAALGGGSVALVLVVGSDASPSASAPLVTTTDEATPRPLPNITPPDSAPVNTIQDAFNVARFLNFNGGPGPDTRNPDAVYYVETTFGQARKVFQVSPDGFNPAEAPTKIPDTTPIFVIVAYGQFPDTHVLGERTPHVYTAMWAMFAIGTQLHADNVGNEQYDLSQLGTVGVVEVPLPPQPTPVTFNTPIPSQTGGPVSTPVSP